MYRIPKDLDLSPMLGTFATQIHVGQFDLQLTFGPVHFTIQAPVKLFRDGELFAYWQEGQWPDPGFYETINTNVRHCDVLSDRLIVIEFENGIAMHLEDSSDEYETMQIYFQSDLDVLII